MATVKVTLAKEMAIWCAPTLAAPSPPASTPASANTPISAEMWRPIGIPTRPACARSAHTGVRTGRPAPSSGRARTAASTIASCSSVHSDVASAEPATPMAGTARSGPKYAGRSAPPNTSRMSANRLTTLAATVATTSGRVKAVDWRYERIVRKASISGMLGARHSR